MREAKAPARQWFDRPSETNESRHRSRWKSSDQQARNAAAVTGSVAYSEHRHEFASNLSISSLELLGAFALDTWAGRPAANHARSPLMGHRSQEGDDAWQTSAPLVP